MINTYMYEQVAFEECGPNFEKGWWLQKRLMATNRHSIH